MRADPLPIELDGLGYLENAFVGASPRITFSVVINTDNRLAYLKRTLEGLKYSTYRDFEVCVVAGPTPDGTREFLETIRDQVKVAHCPERVLSMSRNIGIAMAAGDVVCFIDDDAVPEPEWLEQLAPAFTDPRVGGAGGFVYDHTGVSFQARYVTTNRLGYATNWDGPAPHLNFPFSQEIPHLLGTNCAFRRSALLKIGGFDEEYEYFLDETDVCCRIIDAGFTIEQVEGAYVHHKYAPSHMRDERRIVRNWYPLIKNRLYFGRRNARLHHSAEEIFQAALSDVRNWDHSVREAHDKGDYTSEDVARFESEMRRALVDAEERARQPIKLLSQETVELHQDVFRHYPLWEDGDRRKTFCLVTQDYPPGQNGGIARNMFHLGRALAAQGHHVHVLTKAKGHSTVDFEDGVWVHRIAIRHYPAPDLSPIAPHTVPSHIWNYSETMMEEVDAINRKRQVDAVYCPLWDCEPLGFILNQKYPLIVALQTSMRFWLESQPLKARDEHWMEKYGNPIVAMEELILERAPLLHANSQAIVADIRKVYDAKLQDARIFYSPHGMEDWAEKAAPSARDDNELRMLFVGRLESRKGIDTLLEAVPKILKEHPSVVLDIVGDDTVPRPDGTTYKEEFLAKKLPKNVSRRIHFHGRVEEDRLLEFYRDCDLFVAPSRYESFGLVFLEAMVFGKPVIACGAGGAVEVVNQGKTGLLVATGNASELQAAIEVLVKDKVLRTRMGLAGRTRFEERFSAEAMGAEFLEAVGSLTKDYPAR
jgi:hypothetical protein